MNMIEPGMTVMVTGATGFVGGAVAQALCAAGYKVIAVVRSPRRAAHLPAGQTMTLIGDMLRPETYQPMVEQADAVVHAAQLRVPGRMTRARLARLDAAEETMTTALVTACTRYGRRLVYTSGCFGYGDHGDEWITEETPLSPSPLGVGHARQVELLRALRGGGPDSVVLHLGFVYGPGGNFASAFHAQARAGRLRCIGGGANHWSCVHVDDVAAAYVAALERAPAGAEYNIVDDAPVTLRNLVDGVTGAMDLPRAGNVPATLAKAIIGRPAVRSLVTSYRVRNAKAREELEWTPRFPTVDAGLPSVIADLGKTT